MNGVFFEYFLVIWPVFSFFFFFGGAVVLEIEHA